MTDPVEIALTAIRIYADMHPRPTHVNQVQAAKMLDISRDTLRNLIRAGVLSLNACGQIPIEQIDAARAARRAA